MAVKRNPGPRPKKPKIHDSKKEAPLPRAPSYLPSEAKKEWRKTVEYLSTMGLLQNTDLVNIECYCEAVGDFREIVSRINDLKSGLEMNDEENVGAFKLLLRMRDQATVRIRRFNSIFGLSPMDRGKLKYEPPQEENTSLIRSFLEGGEDDFEEYLD